MSRIAVAIAVLLAYASIRPALAQPRAATSAPAQALSDVRKAQVDAATNDAQESIRQGILAAPVTPDLSVGQFLQRTTAGSDDLTKIVQNAQQIGGTRWTPDQTCEVRLELSGREVVAALQPILASHADKLPAPREALARGLDSLRSRVFRAFGKSVGSRNMVRFRPGAGAVAWRNVKDADRGDAVEAAKVNAVNRVLESLRPVSIGRGKELSDALAVAEINREISEWIAARPVTEVEFGDALDVRLTLSAPPQELWPVVQSALTRSGFGPPAQDAEGWEPIRAAMIRAMAPATGSATATGNGANAGVGAALPKDPPAWAGQQLDAEGTAGGGGLKGARAAEAIALDRLRAKIEILPLSFRSTLGEAAKADRGIARALDRVVRRAPSTKVDYLDRGVVKVQVSVDLEDVWRAVSSER